MIKKKFEIPTGYLFTSECSRGELETLSIGDYGKHYNVKADFLGYTKPIRGVPNIDCMPLSEKWVITLSTQYGCSMTCNFCSVPEIKFRGNATFDNLKQQLYNAISLFPSVSYTERLNIHFARMGDPIFNKDVFEFATWLYTNKHQIYKDTGLRIEVVHPVLTTSLPRKFKQLKQRILSWCHLKNVLYNGQAGLQFSINSTSESQRDQMFNSMQIRLEDLSKIAQQMPEPVGRKYCLNFAYATDFEIDAEKVNKLFDKEKFMVKITPIHNNNACRRNNIETVGGYDSWEPYQTPEEQLKSLGWDVLVFVPSMDEEDGLVTCGNLILGGDELKVETDAIKIRGLEPIESV